MQYRYSCVKKSVKQTGGVFTVPIGQLFFMLVLHLFLDMWSECISVHAPLVKCLASNSSWSPVPFED